MLLTHVATVHAGEAIGPEARRRFAEFGRGICLAEGCGALRALDQPKCRKCNRLAPSRALAEGDVVPGNSSRPAASSQRTAAPPAASQPVHVEPAEPARVDVAAPRAAHELPPDFLARVQGLSPQTMERIPGRFREQLCLATAELVEGCNAGDESASVLERARSKLLLAHLPKGSSTPVEMRKRLDLWAAGRFLELLERIEEQQRAARASGKTARARGARAHALARRGAYRKGAQSLGTVSAQLSPEQQRTWAATLLPDSARPPSPVVPREPPPEPESQDGLKALEGVHFSRLSAPGRSGMRPEHLRDMLACNRRRAVNRLLRAIQATEGLAVAGALPQSWRWMLESRLVFLAKKHGPKPRPIRVGEVWRRLVAKHSLHQHSAKVRQRMLAAHQYGVAIPGGTDILVHARRVLEEAVRRDVDAGVWAVIDVDLVNAFPSFEWDSVGDAMATAMPELEAWTRWCHERAADVELPCGELHRARRGAEQGDPHGSLQCGAVVAVLVRAAMAELARRKGAPLPECFSFWYCDDGQVVCRPKDVDLFLECLDAAAARVGATRGEGPDVKSLVRLVGHPDALAAFQLEDPEGEWLTPRVRRTCKVGAPNAACEVLGAAVGPADACEQLFRDRLEKLKELHDALPEVDDPATELTLGRLCASVTKSTHVLRAAGDCVGEAALEDHDAALDRFVSRALGGDLPKSALDQAALGVSQGGLGFRRATGLALPAFVASRVEARPFVEHLFASMANAGVAVPGAMALYDAQTAAAAERVGSGLSAVRGELAGTFCQTASEAAQRQFEAIRRGERLEQPGAPVGAGRAADHLLGGERGSEDPEHPASGAARRPRLQRLLATLVDKQHLEALNASPEDTPDSQRLADVAHETSSAEWLWALDPAQPESLEPDAYVPAVRMRLGAGFALEPLRCACCGGTLDPGGTHSTCCALGESTRGHNGVQDIVLDLALVADSTAEKEVIGLLDTAPGLRPADVLTSAVTPGVTTALDVGIAAPAAQGAGEDCTEAMRVRKRRKYAKYLPALEAEGVVYKPMVWSCWGREHPDTTAALTSLARQAARRRGLGTHKELLRQTRARVGAALARRTSAMLRACLPRAVS